jgi:membrane protease YdiL (CAAX protease family)
MNKYLKFDVWRPALGWLCLFVFAQLTVNIITLLLIAVRKSWIDISQSMMITLPTTINYIFFLLFLSKYRKEALCNVFYYSPWKEHNVKDTLLLPFLGMFLLIFPVNMIDDCLQLEDVMKMQFDALMHNPVGIMILAVLAPIIEETVFRVGILGSLLRNGVRPWLAILASALIFALVHMNPAQMPGAFLLGGYLGWIYYRTGTGVPCILTHIFNNYFAIVCTLALGTDITTAQLLGGSTQAWGISMVCLLFFAVIVWLMAISKKKEEKF